MCVGLGQVMKIRGLDSVAIAVKTYFQKSIFGQSSFFPIHLKALPEGPLPERCKEKIICSVLTGSQERKNDLKRTIYNLKNVKSKHTVKVWMKQKKKLGLR